MTDTLWLDTANAVVRAGMIPLPVTETIIELLKTMMTPEQAALLLLAALTTSDAAIAASQPSTGTSANNLLPQVQNLLATLRSMNRQLTTASGTSTTP